MTLHINRTLYVARYIQYVCNTLGACALGMFAKIVNAGHCRAAAFLTQSTGELLTIMDDSGFFSTLRIDLCIFSCHAMCILVVPFDSLAS